LKRFSHTTIAAVAILLLPTVDAAADDGQGDRGGNQTDCSSCCDRCCCCDDARCCPCDPVLTASVDWVFLQRGRLGNIPVYETAAGANIFNASQFNFDFASGVDATLSYQMNPRAALEGRYLWVDTWQDSRGSYSVNLGDLWMVTPPEPQFPFTFSPNYYSRFQSAEVNLCRTVSSPLDVLAGVRYVGFSEEYRELYPGFPSSLTRWASGNDLIGFQLGARGSIWDIRPGLRVLGSAKAGIYYNSAHSSAELIFPVFKAFTADNRGRVAFLGELELLLSYQMSLTWSARFGYHLIWLDGVATAADQIPNTSGIFSGFTTTTDTANSVFFHGVSAGLERRF